MAYDPSVVNAILRIGGRRGESRRYLLEALSTGIVESGLRNLSGGDADSYGFRQQRESIYGRQNLSTQINNFFDELHKLDRGQAPGELSADVQRPAEQYRGRYAQVWDQAKKVLEGKGYAGGDGGPVGYSQPAGGQSPQQQNIFEVLANFNRGTQDQQDPENKTLQQGWDLLAQLAGGSNQSPLQTGLPTVMTSGGGKPGAIRRGLHEAFYNPVGDFDEGKPIGAVEGHDTHAHFGGKPSAIAAIVRRAQRNGLAVREYAPVDPVDPVHAKNSWHYRYGGRGGVDISGNQDQLAAFFRRMLKRAGLS